MCVNACTQDNVCICKGELMCVWGCEHLPGTLQFQLKIRNWDIWHGTLSKMASCDRREGRQRESMLSRNQCLPSLTSLLRRELYGNICVIIIWCSFIFLLFFQQEGLWAESYMLFNLEENLRSCKPVPVGCEWKRGRCCLMDNEMWDMEMECSIGAKTWGYVWAGGDGRME